MTKVSAQSYRVLLIDDDEDDYILARDLLNQTPVIQSLEWADNYEDGIKLVLQDSHDVYLVDYYLGAETGIDLLKAVREKGSRAPIILLTGRDSEGIDLDALEAGAADYLDKNALNPTIVGRVLRYAVHQQRTRNQLEDALTKVTQLEQIKTDMIRIAAHDLRTPLTVMHGYIDMLLEDLKDDLKDNQRTYLEQLHHSVERMQRMVQDILSLERILEMSGGHNNQFDFSALVKNSFEHYQKQHPHTMTLHLPKDPVMVYGIEPLLREAIENLLSNAVKYTPKDGKIGVDISADADFILFTVKDTGFGIPKDLQDRLFHPFYRAKIKEARKIEGTGLGLNLVKNIVERHNGNIHFESEYGKGSTFGFMLPNIEDD